MNETQRANPPEDLGGWFRVGVESRLEADLVHSCTKESRVSRLTILQRVHLQETNRRCHAFHSPALSSQGGKVKPHDHSVQFTVFTLGTVKSLFKPRSYPYQGIWAHGRAPDGPGKAVGSRSNHEPPTGQVTRTHSCKGRATFWISTLQIKARRTGFEAVNSYEPISSLPSKLCITIPESKRLGNSSAQLTYLQFIAQSSLLDVSAKGRLDFTTPIMENHRTIEKNHRRSLSTEPLRPT